MIEWQDYYPTGGSTVTGTLKLLPGLESPQLQNSRDILVWLPSSYVAEPDRRYPVLYMHDGQNLFDQATSFAGESQREAAHWKVDEAMQGLSRDGLEAIVVGIAHAGAARLDEYSPYPDPVEGGGQGEAYLAFLVETLKPLVDSSLRTRPGRADTAIIGSSLGGLISLYAFFRYPDIFGLAGALSPALNFGRRAIFAMLRPAPFVGGRIYLDVGTHEYSHSDKPAWLARFYSWRYTRTVRAMARLLRRKGYRPGHDLLYVQETGAPHHETAWARRFPGAVRFLYRNTTSG